MKFINPTEHTMEVPVKHSVTGERDSINLAPNGGRAEPPSGFELDTERASKAIRTALVIIATPQATPANDVEETH